MMIRRKLILGCFVFVLGLGVPLAAAEPVWKVGQARAKITPQKLFWLAGFGARTRPAEGTLHDLWLKVLAIEDAEGHVVVVVTADLLGFPKAISDNVCREIGRKHRLERSQIMLSASHTHSGPVLRDALFDIYPLDDAQRALIAEYSAWLEKRVVATIEQALAARTPATLWAGQGTARFAVNRRTNVERNLPDMIQRGIPPKGPSDFAVPVLAVRNPDGSLRAVVCGYAAHTSTLSGYQWSGDYASFTQLALEKAHPNVQAMFFQGCGSDQSAAPRGTPERSRIMGEELATAVEQALASPMRPLEPRLRTAMEMIVLDFGEQPSRAQLEAVAQRNDYQGRWARRLLKEADQGRSFAKSYPEYPVQAWKLGRDQLWITLGGEVCVDYALSFKKRFGPATWVAGYTNDVMSYIPSRRVWQEGGYESGAFEVYGLPVRRWCADIEDRITAAAVRVAGRVMQ
jgi:hypothetical protein